MYNDQEFGSKKAIQIINKDIRNRKKLDEKTKSK